MENKLTHDELQEVFKNYKKCPRCHIVKSLDEGFYKCRSECKSSRVIDLKKMRDIKKEEID